MTPLNLVKNNNHTLFFVLFFIDKCIFLRIDYEFNYTVRTDVGLISGALLILNKIRRLYGE